MHRREKSEAQREYEDIVWQLHHPKQPKRRRTHHIRNIVALAVLGTMMGWGGCEIIKGAKEQEKQEEKEISPYHIDKRLRRTNSYTVNLTPHEIIKYKLHSLQIDRVLRHPYLQPEYDIA